MDLVGTPAQGPDWRVGLEMIEGGTGKLRANVEIDVDDPGVEFRAGDVLFGKLRPYLAKVWLADRSGAAVGDIHVYRPGPCSDTRFLAYALLDQAFIDQVAASTYGAKMPRANWNAIKQIQVPGPPLEQQQRIADFLDRETAQIDTLIDKQHSLRSDLRERRVAMVNEAIAAAPGTGRTPLREAAVIQSGLTLGKRYEGQTTEFPYLRVANIQTGYLDLTEVKTVAVPVDDARKTMLRPGDVLMTEGGDRAALGRGSLWNGEIDPCLHQNHVFAVRPKHDRLLAEYMVYVLEARGAREYFESTRRQTTNLSATNAGLVRAFRFTLPSIQEQRKIVSDLDVALSHLKTLLAKAEQFIALARERRAALITAAVTGQLDIASKEAA